MVLVTASSCRMRCCIVTFYLAYSGFGATGPPNTHAACPFSGVAVAGRLSLALLVTLDGPSAVPVSGLELHAGPVRWLADNTKKGISVGAASAVAVHLQAAFSAAHYADTEAELARLVLPCSQVANTRARRSRRCPARTRCRTIPRSASRSSTARKLRGEAVPWMTYRLVGHPATASATPQLGGALCEPPGHQG